MTKPSTESPRNSNVSLSRTSLVLRLMRVRLVRERADEELAAGERVTDPLFEGCWIQREKYTFSSSSQDVRDAADRRRACRRPAV